MMIITSKDKIDAERCVDQAWRDGTRTSEEAQDLRGMIHGVPVGAAVRAPTLPMVRAGQVAVTPRGPYERLVLGNE